MDLDAPIFARTRYVYDSYSDFWRLVELSGFETCYTDEIDLERECIYIVTPINGELRPHVRHRKSTLKGAQRAQIIVWSLERPDSGDLKGKSVEQAVLDANSEILNYVTRIWTSDRWVASVDPRSNHVILGSHPDLRQGPKGDPQYDLIHLSYTIPRRRGIYDGLAASGLKIAGNCWGADRDWSLRITRAMLNVHQTPAPIMEPLRIAIAAAYKLPYLSEFTRDPYPLEEGVSFLQAEYLTLESFVLEWMQDDLAPIGEALHQRLCIETTFKIGVLKGLLDTFEGQ
jgi:hypothetical protein